MATFSQYALAAAAEALEDAAWMPEDDEGREATVGPGGYMRSVRC